jgi:uridine phosphorylase
MTDNMPPILNNKVYQAPSVFTPGNLLREARRQKAVPTGSIPPICILDPDGDIVRYLLDTGQATCNPYWACYHTKLYNFIRDGLEYGIIGGAVGASFAVLVAEELFSSGCQLLISITSAGQITPIANPPYFILIDRALRDEGTSYHYLPPAPYSRLSLRLVALFDHAFEHLDTRVIQGAIWTTDAPFRETEQAVEYCRAEGILGVEMEAAALYAFAEAASRNIICFAQITNQMGRIEGDFEKGTAQGSHAALEIIELTGQRWSQLNP